MHQNQNTYTKRSGSPVCDLWVTSKLFVLRSKINSPDVYICIRDGCWLTKIQKMKTILFWKNQFCCILSIFFRQSHFVNLIIFVENIFPCNCFDFPHFTWPFQFFRIIRFIRKVATQSYKIIDCIFMWSFWSSWQNKEVTEVTDYRDYWVETTLRVNMVQIRITEHCRELFIIWRRTLISRQTTNFSTKILPRRIARCVYIK